MSPCFINPVPQFANSFSPWGTRITPARLSRKSEKPSNSGHFPVLTLGYTVYIQKPSFHTLLYCFQGRSGSHFAQQTPAGLWLKGFKLVLYKYLSLGITTTISTLFRLQCSPAQENPSVTLLACPLSHLRQAWLQQLCIITFFFRAVKTLALLLTDA